MAKRKIVNVSNWSAGSYKFTFWMKNGHEGMEYLTGLYRHRDHGFIHIYAEERFAWATCVVGKREIRVTCEPGSIKVRSMERIAAQLLIPRIEQEIAAWQEATPQ